MNADQAYKLVLYATAKNKSQGFVSPDDFNLIINAGIRSQISFLLGTVQQYAPGRPVARVELGQNSVIRQRLAPTIYGYVLDINSQGQSSYPGDYLQTDTMYNYPSIYGYHRIRYVEQTQKDSNLNSVIDKDPIYLLEDKKFQFYRTTTQQAQLRYVRNPPETKWAFVLDSNGIPIYDPINSVDPIFDDLFMYEAIMRALLLVGVNLQANVVMQYANEIKQQGQ